jgi:phage/plasmid-like protein (TIGR03299 family)
MAHELHIINGEAQMAYVRDEGLPWHGLGSPLKGDESLEEWIIAAGLDWEALRQPTFTINQDGQLQQLRRDVLVHSKTAADLGFVTEHYKVVQPREIMDAFKEIAGSAGYTLKTAGNLHYGKRIWALADCGDEFSVDKKGKDVVRRNILLSTSFDNSMATIVDPTTVRVVCQNTLAMAAGYSGERAKVRIGHTSEFDPAAVRADLLAAGDDIDKSWENFKVRALRLASRKVSLTEATEFFVKLFGNPDEEGEVDIENKATQRILRQVVDIYQDGQGQEVSSAQGTAWGLVNTVTRWADHERVSQTNDGRLMSAFFGNGADYKERAMEDALALAA